MPILRLPPACPGEVLNDAVVAASGALRTEGTVRIELSLPVGRERGPGAHANGLLYDLRDALAPLLEDSGGPIGTGGSCELTAAVTYSGVSVEGPVSWLRDSVGRFVPGLEPMDNGVYRNIGVMRVQSSLFDEPVILTSDLHRDAAVVMGWIASELDEPARWNVLACGDMAGTSSFRQDSGPAQAYRAMLDLFSKVHFVLGNHDESDQALLELSNADGSRCHLDAGDEPAAAHVAGRSVVGVSGIIGRPTRPRRRTAEDFSARVGRALRAAGAQAVLLTHETPKVPGFEPAYGRPELSEVVRASRPLAHAWGHCHLSPVALPELGTLHVCADARVLLVEPLPGGR